MIRDRERFSGCVLLRLIDDWEGSLSFQKLQGRGTGFYLIAGCLPVFIKYAKARRGPWTFTFQADHIAESREVAIEYGECIIVLVCGTDGIAAVDYDQFSQLTEVESAQKGSIAIRRRLNEMYAVKGSKGALDGKIGGDSLLAAVRRHLVRD